MKWGQVYRSGELPRLSDGDVAKLEELEIHTVVSFLTEKEIEARGPDRLPDGTVEVALSMEAGNMGELTAVANEARRTGDFSQVSPEINPDIVAIFGAVIGCVGEAVASGLAAVMFIGEKTVRV